MAEAETTFSKTIPPPVLGWNTKDPISQMDPLYSPGPFENYFPGNGTVDLRNGYTQHVSTGSGGGYSHLAELVNTAGTHFLIGFSISGGGGPGILYNDTSSGSGTAITGGFTTGSIENYTANYRGRLYAKGYVNTSDLLSTDGTAATQPAFTGPGGDDKDLWRMCVYKGRLYFLTISDASMWYPEAVGSITGALVQWDWQSLLTLGGKPWYIGNFAMTAGDISQTYFIMISEQGEVLLYAGSYPGSADWGEVGRYFIPAPVGRKSFFNWGSDLLVITYDGLVSIKDFIQTEVDQDYTFLSDNISSEFKTAVANMNSTYTNYVQGIVYPKGQYLLVNFYNTVLADTTQLVMNTRTRAWCKFTGQRSLCWSLLNNGLYWGGVTEASASYIALADNGYKDVDPDNSSLTLSRNTKLKFAFNYLDQPGQTKILTECVPIVYESENLALTLNADMDFSDTASTSLNSTTGDTAYKLYSNVRCGLKANPGKAVAIRMDGTATTKRRSIQAVQVFWKDGGIR